MSTNLASICPTFSREVDDIHRQVVKSQTQLNKIKKASVVRGNDQFINYIDNLSKNDMS